MGMVPLNRIFPIDRTRMMLEGSMSRSLIVDTGSEAQLYVLFCAAQRPLAFLSPQKILNKR
jgi:hypothetical protein